eukprot:1158785-Pelagomonas_calceolata.AAC.5
MQNATQCGPASHQAIAMIPANAWETARRLLREVPVIKVVHHLNLFSQASNEPAKYPLQCVGKYVQHPCIGHIYTLLHYIRQGLAGSLFAVSFAGMSKPKPPTNAFKPVCLRSGALRLQVCQLFIMPPAREMQSVSSRGVLD